MWRYKFGAWAVVVLLSALSLAACSDDDDDNKDTFVPPSNIVVALKQLYPSAQDIEWKVKGVYYVADCQVNDDELDVWFNADASWVMTENELDGIEDLVPAVYTAFIESEYSSWTVTDVYFLDYPQQPSESVVQVKQGNQRYALYFSQEGGLLHKRDISNGDDTNWPPTDGFWQP